MTTQRVVILRRQSLFAELIANLLRTETDAEVLEVVGESGDLVSQVAQLNPQTIIVDSQDSGLGLPTLLPLLFEQCVWARGLCLTMDGPCPDVCPAHCTRANTKDDLIRAIMATKNESRANTASAEETPADAEG